MISIDKLRKSRQRNVEVGRFTLVVERPTELRFFQLLSETVGVEQAKSADPESVLREAMANAVFAKACVVGWKGVREIDIVPSGSEDEEPFSRDIADLWIEDRTDVWAPVAEAVFAMRRDARAAREADAKN